MRDSRWLKSYTSRDIHIRKRPAADFPKTCRLMHWSSTAAYVGGGLSYEERCRQAVPITNYGIAIAYMKGILRRNSRLPDLQRLLPEDRLSWRESNKKKQPATEPAVVLWETYPCLNRKTRVMRSAPDHSALGSPAELTDFAGTGAGR